MIEQLEQVHMLMQTKRFDMALERVENLLAEYPDTSDFHKLKADILIERNEFKKAKAAVERAIQLNPEDDRNFYTLTRVFIGLDQLRRAEKSIDQAIDLDPEDANYYGMKSLILVDTDRAQKALEVVKHGLEIDAENSLCLNAQAMILNRLGKTGSAHVELTDLLEKNPENDLAHSNMGWSYLRKGQPMQAKVHFMEALRIDPESEFAKEGMLEAIKSTNWVYRKFLQYTLWMQQKTERNRWAFIIGFLVVAKLLPFLMPVYLILVAWTWLSGPLGNVIVYFDKFGRYLFSDQERLSTQVNIGLIGLAIISAAILAPVMNIHFVGLAFFSFITIIPVHLMGQDIKTRGRVLQGLFALTFLGCGLVGALIAVGNPPIGRGILIAGFIAGVIYSWVSSFTLK